MELINLFAKVVHLAAPYLSYLLVVILILSVTIVTYLFYKSRKQKKPQFETEEPPPNAIPKDKVFSYLTQIPSLSVIKATFRHGLQVLRDGIPGRNYRYEIPWYLMIGEPGSGKTTLLKNSGMDLPLGTPEEVHGMRNGFNWWFFNQGVVLDVDGDYFQMAENKTPDIKDWATFLQSLLESRPQRAIDGVILTFPAGGLMDPKSSQADRIARAGQKAASFYDKLMTAQKMLGMRFPVYVLVTQCDHIPGFQGFCRALPQVLQNDIFGWSNPHSLEESYAAHWVDEAFQSLDEDLYRTQTKILANDISPKDQDGVFLFPGEVMQLKESLRAVLDNLFRKTLYRESFYFRGLYFCGNVGKTPTPEQNLSQDPARQSKPKTFEWFSSLSPAGVSAPFFFIKDLFEKKVFPEFRLGRPVVRVFRWRKRATWLARSAVIIIALVWGLGMWTSYDTLDREKKNLLNYMGVMDQVLEKKDAVGKKMSEEKHFNKGALSLLNAWGSVNEASFSSVFFPSSWDGSMNKRIEGSMVEAYDSIIIDNLAWNLKNKAKKILSGIIDKAPISEPSILGLGTPQSELEFMKVKDTVHSLIELERNLGFFNGLKSSTDLVGLGRVVQYLHNVVLPEDFYKHANHYQKALRLVDDNQVDLSFHKQAFASMVKHQAEVWLDKLFDDNRLETTLKDYSHYIKRMQSRRVHFRVRSSDDQLKVFLEKTLNLQDIVGSPVFAWIKKDALKGNPQVDHLLQSIETSGFLGNEVDQKIKQSIDRRIADLNERLVNYESDLTGPYLSKENMTVEMRLSQDLQNIMELLGDYFEDGFTVSAGHRDDLIVDPMPHSKVFWNKDLLVRGVEIYNEYIQFTQDYLPKFPNAIRRIVKRTAKGKLEINILDQLAQAQQVEVVSDGFAYTRPERDLAQEIKNFKDSVHLLAKLMDILQDLDYIDSSEKIFHLISTQSFNLLKRVDRLFEKDGLYRIRGNDFSWWEGDASISLAAFDASDGEDLKYSLSTQRQRIKRLAKEYVQTLLAFLVNRSAGLSKEQQELVSKWQRIILELDKYDAQKPSNSVSSLEHFITFKLDKITQKNCLDELQVESGGKRTLDFFAGTLTHIKQKLIDRCQSLDKGIGTDAYDIVEGFFNKHLAGKFPFAELSDKPIANEADVKDIKEFFQLFDNYIKGEFLLWEKVRQIGDPEDDDVFGFVNEMKQVRKFLQPFWADLEPGKPEYFMGIGFRANREHEVQGNEVIEWKIETRQGTSLNQQDEKGLIPWKRSDPLKISFRWAKDAPHFPVGGGDWKGFKVRDHMAVFEYKNRWSLIHLLVRQKISPFDLEGLADLKPHTLKFTLKTQGHQQKVPKDKKSHQVVQPAALRQASLFVRVVLKSPDKKRTLELPVFPVLAPRWSMNMING